MLYLIVYDANSRQLVIYTNQIVEVDIFSMLSIKTYIRLGQVCTHSLTTFCRAQYRAESSVNIPNDLLFSGLCSNYSSANKENNRRRWFYFLWHVWRWIPEACVGRNIEFSLVLRWTVKKFKCGTFDRHASKSALFRIKFQHCIDLK